MRTRSRMKSTIQTLKESRIFNATDSELVKSRLRFLRENLARAANRGDKSEHIEISLDDLYRIGEKQNWLCALSGQPLEFVRGGTHWGGKWCNPKSCTIDRVNSDQGYVKGNVQLLVWEVNYIKQHLDSQNLVSICKKIAKHCTK